MVIILRFHSAVVIEVEWALVPSALSPGGRAAVAAVGAVAHTDLPTHCRAELLLGWSGCPETLPGGVQGPQVVARPAPPHWGDSRGASTRDVWIRAYVVLFPVGFLFLFLRSECSVFFPNIIIMDTLGDTELLSVFVFENGGSENAGLSVRSLERPDSAVGSSLRHSLNFQVFYLHVYVTCYGYHAVFTCS